MEQQYSPFGKPPGIDEGKLQQLRTDALAQIGEHAFSLYEKDSQYTPHWLCPDPQCQTDNPCAAGSCIQCHNDRPAIFHGDPDADDNDPFLGLARRVARGQPAYVEQLSYYLGFSIETLERNADGAKTPRDKEIFTEMANIKKHISTWRSNHGYRVDDYKFKAEVSVRGKIKESWVDWRGYVDFLLRGGRVT